jgi:hypothetical protein
MILLFFIPIFFHPIPTVFDARKIALNTVDTAEYKPDFALYRITKINADEAGVIVKIQTGEKIRSVSISPRHQFKVIPLNGCLSSDGSCQGDAPTIFRVFRIRPVLFKTTGRMKDGGSSVIFTTNSNSTYSFYVRPGTPAKRMMTILP